MNEIIGYQPGGRKRKDTTPRLEGYSGHRRWIVSLCGKSTPAFAPTKLAALVVGLSALGLDWRKMENYMYADIKEERG